jgi:hypothetical protein
MGINKIVFAYTQEITDLFTKLGGGTIFLVIKPKIKSTLDYIDHNLKIKIIILT